MPSQEPLVITEDFTIYNAMTLKQVLLDALAEQSELVLDLAQVQQMDTAGLQLLILLKQEAVRAGKCVRIVGHSQPVSAVIDLCNLAAEFGDPLIIPAEHTA